MPTLCNACGFNNPEGMRFCGQCGTRLTDTASSSNSPSSENLGPMMGADLLERFRRAGLESAGQRRNVTILFADIAGYTHLSEQIDDEDLYRLIQEYISLLATDVYKYEGAVDKFTGDGLMALFGAPIAHENNAELAVRAALDMQVDVAQLSRSLQDRLGLELQLHLGLHSGPVIVGSIGSNMLMNYTAIGDTVNLARRLEEASAPGTILVSETVYQATKALFGYEPVPPLTLKGVARPVPGYRLAGSKAQPGSVRGLEGLRAPLVGREAELNQLKQAAAGLVNDHQGQFVLLTGEGGIGKSRLTAELKAFLHPQSVQLLEGHSLIYRRSVSYWIFLDALRGYFGLTPNLPEPVALERLTRNVSTVLGPRAEETLPYLEYLFAFKAADEDEHLRYLDAGQLRQRVFLAVRDLIVAEAQRTPLLLILDDLHWADEASLDLILFLLDACRQVPLFIHAISRPFQEGPLTKIVEHAQKFLPDRFIFIPLESLAPDQSKQLLNQLLTTTNLPETLREQILQRAAGVPLYLEEMLRMLIDGGLLRRAAEGWQLASEVDAATLGVPDTLQGLILARFDRLDPTRRRILQVASVIGRHFNAQLLNAVIHPAASHEIQNALPLLIEREFIVRQSDTSEIAYSFKHILVSDAIYSSLLRRERAELHGQVGEAIEALFADRLEEEIELLARHYSWSPRLDRAVHYLLRAGQKAMQGYANEQARQHYEQALNFLPQVEHSLEQVLAVRTGLGDVLMFIGEYQAAREHYQQALAAIPPEKPDRYAKERSALERKVGATFERQGDFDQALLCLAAAEGALAELPTPTPIEQAQVFNAVGWIHFRRGNLGGAEAFLMRALTLAENTPQRDLIASIYNRLGGIYYQEDKLDQAGAYVRKSLALREEIGDIVAVARSYNNLGLLTWKRGDWDSALENFGRSVELHANLGDVEGTIELHSNLGLLQLDRGNVEAARKHLQTSLTSAQQIGHAYIIGLTDLYFSRLHLSVEDWSTALETSRRSLQTFKDIGVADHLVDVYTNMGLAHLGLDEWDAAQACGQEALSLFDQAHAGKASAPTDDRARALRLLSEVARLRGDLGEAERLLKESAAIFSANGNQLEQGRSSVAQAMLAVSLGNHANARVWLNEARLIFRQLGAELDLHRLETLSTKLVGH